MLSPVLSVLLMGMIPVWGIPAETQMGSQSLAVAQPADSAAESLQFRPLTTRLSASGALIIDLKSGQTLFAAQAAVPRPMASLTKLMTALLIVEHHGLDEIVTIPKDIKTVQGNVAKLPPGERFTVGDLLTALLVTSANDAAVALAAHHSGSIPAFVSEMNERARVLGLRSTSYENPTGLDAPGQISTPQDLAWLLLSVLRKDAIAKRMSLTAAAIESREGTRLSFPHTHALLRTEPHVTAGKTGTTDNALQCLLSVVERDGRMYGVIFLHSSDRYADMRLALNILDP